jgi:hypothetical protein
LKNRQKKDFIWHEFCYGAPRMGVAGPPAES